QFEVLGYWLSNFCFMGRTLRSGQVPALNPHLMGGVPFAADPFAGWTNAPAMATFTALLCEPAFRVFMLLLPLLAGLGLYWFLRSEGTSRAAATVGGLVLAMSIAGTRNIAYPWVSGTLAWTALTLAAASRLVRAASWPRRLLWAAATALAWGQAL